MFKTLNGKITRIFLLVLSIFSIVSCRTQVKLIANGVIEVYASEEAAANRRGVIITSLKKGDILNIVQCHDRKTVMVLEVKLNEGKRGYISYGPYQLDGSPNCS